MSSESKMVAFERQLQRTKLLVTLTTEARDKLLLNEKYLRHLRGLLEEGNKTSVDLKLCHEERFNEAVAAIQELAKAVDGVDRNKEAVDQLRERVTALGLKISMPNATGLGVGSPALATTATQSLPVLANAGPDVGAKPKRVHSGSPGLSTSTGGTVRRPIETCPKTYTKNSIIKHFDLPRNSDEMFNNCRSDQPPERFVEVHRRLAIISEEQEAEKPHGGHTPIM